MTNTTDDQREQEVGFTVERGVEMIERSGALGFYKRDTVGVEMDNQAHGQRYYIYPHSTLQIETIGNDGRRFLTTEDWLSLAEALTISTGLDIALVMGERGNTKDYYRTPLGCGVGLIRVYWINCFGRADSDLIPRRSGSTSFFRREVFGEGCQAFVSAASYEAYEAASPGLLASQRAEIGEDLFHRLPVEERAHGGQAWIFSPKVILHIVRFLIRQKGTNWRRYQARTLPAHYAR